MRKIMTMTATNNDPWSEIAAPSPNSQFNANLVDPELKWRFYWAKGPDSKCALILNHSQSSGEGIHVPNLKGIEVSFIPEVKGGQSYLLFKLNDNEHRDIFYQLCADIVESTRESGTEREAVSITISRAWRWHHLLRGGSDRRLSLEEQKGLIGELLVIERVLLEHLSPVDAINSWTGPLDAPKDFEVGGLCIESKARRGAATPFISISSEFQLDTEGIDSLYLHVSELNRTPPDSKSSFSLTDVVTRVRQIISDKDPGAVPGFEGLLYSSGFDRDDDYSDVTFLEGSHRSYLVEEDFPKITRQNFLPGPSRVRYSLSLSECDPYKVNFEELIAAVDRFNSRS